MLRLEVFEETDFSVKRYIDDLVMQTPPVQVTDHQSHTSDHDDLLPFITTFETHLVELTKLRDQVVSKLAKIEEELAEESFVNDVLNGLVDNYEVL